MLNRETFLLKRNFRTDDVDVPEFGDWDTLTDPGPSAGETAQGASRGVF